MHRSSPKKNAVGKNRDLVALDCVRNATSHSTMAQKRIIVEIDVKKLGSLSNNILGHLK